MPKKTPAHLKLHREPRLETQCPLAVESAAVQNVCRAFEQCTGWELELRGQDGSETRFEIARSAEAGKPVVSREQVQPLAGAVSELIAELQRTREALWQREAELAAGVPIAARPQEKLHLAERLEAVLKGGTQAVGCQASGLYLLDDATTQLKLRACWGLPKERLLEPARPLKGAIADLEALVGHAVVLEDASLLPQWRVPEPFPAAVCVPVSGSTTPLGTLWVYSEQPRDFTAQQTNLVEIVAGRIASDLEREMLLQEGMQAKRVKMQWTGAAAWQQKRLPNITPLLDGWQVAGWSCQADGVGGDFYDWSVHNDGRLALAIGDAHGSMLQAGFTAAVLQAALRSHADYGHTVGALMAKVNSTLWTGSSGDEFASLFYGLLDPDSGLFEWSLAGSATVLLVSRDQHESISTDALPLGASPESQFPLWNRRLKRGDVAVAMSEGVLEARDHGWLRFGETAIATLVRRACHLSAQELAERIRDLVENFCPQRPGLDRSVLVLKRRR